MTFFLYKYGKDMDISSGRFVTYTDINVDEIDIYEDAWGLNTEFADVVSYLRELESLPDEHLANKLIFRLRSLN
jgi:hypothetical protein